MNNSRLNTAAASLLARKQGSPISSPLCHWLLVLVCTTSWSLTASYAQSNAVSRPANSAGQVQDPKSNLPAHAQESTSNLPARVQESPTVLVPDLVQILTNQPSELRDVVERFESDRGSLRRRYSNRYSPARQDILNRFCASWLSALQGISFDGLRLDGRVDYLLLKNQVERQQHELQRDAKLYAEISPLLPFSGDIIALEEDRRNMVSIDPRAAAHKLSNLTTAITTERTRIEHDDSSGHHPSKVAAYRAAQVLGELRSTLSSWYNYYKGYDPLFDWWVQAPYKAADTALDGYARWLRERIVGARPGEDEPIVGVPLGREAVVEDLHDEMIPYTPEELIAIAQREMDWSESDLKRASREMGFGDDWKKALDKVKEDYVAPGKQRDLVRDLEFDAVAFTRAHDLVTIPPLAQETWRIEMTPAQDQKIWPFFTGGEILRVSYPTDEMSEEEKLMAMRGNNIHFAHATVLHEMIPGHRLQEFMIDRYNSHRQQFSTPFWIEGSAFYWETRFWDLGYDRSPEDRIGALFWRMHRSARIIFSLNFHLGKWTPQQCIDFLVDRVGHERANATGEVRRSFNGMYSPLYQAAYMIGGLQFRALHHEIVDSGKMTERQFHDFIYTHGPVPVEMDHVMLLNETLTRSFQPHWRFDRDLPPS